MRARPLVLLGGAAALVLAAVGVGVAASGDDDGAQAAPQPHNGRFHVDCPYSHSAPDDPIVHPGRPGRSHLHVFFGATGTDAFSDAESLLAGDTTCETRQDTAAYWAPALFAGGEQLEPLASTAYYRAAPGVDPADVVPFPTGLMMIGGDATATEPQPLEHIGWACTIEDRPQVLPPSRCQGGLLLQVVFPDCWDGEHLDSPDHRAHVARSGDDGCPDSHPVALPQLEFHVRYPVPENGADLRLASGSLYTGHADFFNAWQPDKLAREVEACIGQDAYC